MATPVDTIRAAVVGNPPDPKKKPDNEGVVTAFEELYGELNTATADLGERIDAVQAQADSGLKPVITLVAATTGNVALTGNQTIDTVVNPSTVMVWKNTDKKENGPYTTGAGAWTRMTAFNSGAELFGQRFFIGSGSANIGKQIGLQVPAGTAVPAVGVDDLVFDVIEGAAISKPGSIDAMRGKGANIASATSIDIYAATGDTVPITGSVDVEDLGTGPAGVERTLLAVAGFKLVASTDIVTPTGDDIDIPAGGTVKVVSDGSGVWIVTSFPGDIAAEAAARKTLIASQAGSGGKYHIHLTDEGVVTSDGTPGGRVVAAFGDGEQLIGSTALSEIGEPGPHRFTDEDGRIPAGPDYVEPPWSPSLSPYFGPFLCGVAGEELTIHLPGLLANRWDDTAKAWMHLTSLETRAYVDGFRGMTFLPEKFGSNARLVIRHLKDDGANFDELHLTVAVAQQPLASPVTISVTFAGDSLFYRQGVAIMLKKLADWGGTFTAIGTLLTEATAAYPSGVLSEAKPGHALYDFVYAKGVDGAQQPLADADIAAYLASWSVTQKRAKNYWLRPADGGDDPADVINGHVLDFAWGYARMGLATPGMFVTNFFRNDSNGMTAAEIYQFFYDHVLLVCRRWEADYGTSAPIVWIVPDCAYSITSGQNDIRDTRDVAAMNGIYQAAQDTTAKLIVCPANAFSTPYSQYDLVAISELPHPITGAYFRNFGDPVHQTGGIRLAAWEHSAMWVLCAAAGLI